ncbi:MAG TPA: DUF4136 domain-containing protein [Vicinamibacterales bacterium]|nr:DUF4136 domain-containing protein [Vicinamibacterales bacterium]
MNRSMLRTLVIAICVSSGPTAAWAQKVMVDYDKEVDFSKYQSYVWSDGEPAANPLVHTRIVNAIEGQLASKGWTKSGANADQSPSAVVVYHAAIDAERELNTWGSGPRWNGFGNARIETILTGQLVVDVYDAATKQLLWRGFASDTVSDDQEKNEKRLNEAVAKLFKQFPPKSARNSR